MVWSKVYDLRVHPLDYRGEEYYTYVKEKREKNMIYNLTGTPAVLV